MKIIKAQPNDLQVMNETAKPVYWKSRFPKQSGKGLCRGCAKPVPPGRKTWCSNNCYNTYCPQIVRRKTWERDMGVCQICGVDLIEAQRKWRASEPDYLKVGWAAFVTWKHSKPKWQADHIIPFVEGGITVLENMRVLCIPCHKARTKAWLAQRKNGCK